MTCEKYQKNNQTHLRVTEYTMEMKTKKMIYYFTNLFPGNEQISSEILKTINDNPLTLFNEMKNVFEGAFSKIHSDMANRVYSKIPMDELYLP